MQEPLNPPRKKEQTIFLSDDPFIFMYLKRFSLR